MQLGKTAERRGREGPGGTGSSGDGEREEVERKSC